MDIQEKLTKDLAGDCSNIQLIDYDEITEQWLVIFKHGDAMIFEDLKNLITWLETETCE